VKYMLLIYMNPAQFETLSEEERNGIFSGHDEFQRVTRASGEFVRTEAFDFPPNSFTVRVRDGRPVVSDGLYLDTKEFCCGYYLVDCASKERAIELAALVPDAKYTGMEVRPLLNFDQG
jgi:hypothetical protein